MKFTIFKVFFFGVFLSEVLGAKNLRDNTTSLLKKCPENQCLVREIREYLNVMYRLKSRKWFSLVSYRSSRTSCNAQIMLPKIKSECETEVIYCAQLTQVSQATPNVRNLSESLSVNVSIN